METPKYAPSIATAPAQPATSHSSSIYGGLSTVRPTGYRLGVGDDVCQFRSVEEELTGILSAGPLPDPLLHLWVLVQ